MIKKVFSVLILIVFLLLGNAVSAQKFSSEGKSFYVSFIPNLVGNPDCEITLSSSTNTKVTLANSSVGFLSTVNLSANKPQAVSIPVNACIPTTNDAKGNEVIRITADDPISVYATNAAPAIADGALAYPEESYGSEYYVASYQGLNTTAHASFIVIATENNTKIDITPSEDTKGGHKKGVKYTITLNKGEMYMEYGDLTNDLTGTHIVAQNKKKIAVYSGTKCVNIPTGCAACDILMEQVIPVSRLGKKYLLAQLSTSTFTPDYTYRIISTENNNKIRANGKFLKTLNKGEVYNEHNVGSAICLTSDKPIMVIQYMQGSTCSNNVGDPAMVIIPPVEQFIKRVSYSTPTYSKFLTHYVYILTEKNSSVNLNGKKINNSKFKYFNSCGDYKYVSIDLNLGSHLVESNEGFSMIAYGYGNFISYAYIGGTSFRNLQFDINVKEPKCGKLDFVISNTGDTGEIISSKWDFGDGTSDTGKVVNKTYQKHGIYTVTNIVTINGDGIIRIDTLTTTARSKPFPKANFTHSADMQCFSEHFFEFKDSSEYYLGAKYKNNQWILGENSPKFQNVSSISRKFSEPGIYDIELITVSSDDCADTLVKQVTVIPSPTAKFDIQDSIQCFAPNQFIIQQQSSIDTTEKINVFDWKFGDNTTSNIVAPTKKYTDTGEYAIELIVAATNGCKDTAFDTVVVLPSPVAKFSITDICFSDIAKFNNTSITKSGANLQYAWNFGDGKPISTQTNPQHYYQDSGAYSVKLIATNKFNCKDSTSKPLKVFPKPEAGFKTTGNCVEHAIEIIDETARFGTQAQNNYWDLDDGKQSNSLLPFTITYNNFGNKEIKLKVVDKNGCKDSITKNLHISPLPNVDFSINNAIQCIKTNWFQFTNTTTLAEGNINNLSWWLNGVAVGSQQQITNKFSQTGEYITKLVTVSDSGCTDSVQKNVVVNPSIKVDVTVNNIAQCFNEHNFSFDNKSVVDGTGVISEFTWIYSDNTQDTKRYPDDKKFNSNGTYTILSIMETDKGCLDTFMVEVEVYKSPQPNFDANDICLGDSVYFDNTTTDNDKVKWFWEFGDGTTSLKESPYRIYTATGNYEVKLYAETDKGCKDTIAKYFPNLVKPQPKSFFENILVDSYDKYTTYQFTNKSQGETTYLWDFGDGTTSTNENPQKIYGVIGQFPISLTVSNSWNCDDTYTKKIDVVPTAYINIPNAFSPGSRDTLNAYFRVEGIYFTKEIEMHIFNRWGEEIFYSNQLAPKWDGQYKGELVPDGIYTYLIRILDYKNKLHIYKGNLTVIK